MFSMNLLNERAFVMLLLVRCKKEVIIRAN